MPPSRAPPSLGPCSLLGLGIVSEQSHATRKMGVLGFWCGLDLLKEGKAPWQCVQHDIALVRILV